MHDSPDPLSSIQRIVDDSAADAVGENVPNGEAGIRASLKQEFSRMLDRGETVSLDECRRAFPEHSAVINAAFVEAVSRPDTSDTSVKPPATDQTHGAEPSAADSDSADRPLSFGRYRVEDTVGAGAFGIVYRGWDEQLQRPVAIKVARPGSRSAAEVARHLEEARFLARLDHPGIVAVFDVGQMEQGQLYLVSKFVQGDSLSRVVRRSRPGVRQAAELIARVAEALDYAHRQGVVHRDVKPGNILLDCDGTPVLVDFGLALKESEFGRGARFVGTPVYMSPEQARQEGHRVDGRTDIYSLGLVLYELLTGRRPFAADELPVLLEAIRRQEPRPPRQIDRAIPRELERICLKAIAKRVADRYTTAGDLADDLRRWLDESRSPVPTESAAAAPTVRPEDSARSERLDQVPVIPKGLRCFDESDADFFLQLLPGPRDRQGLPQSVRFWKHQIENDEPDTTFPVGVLLGPSGSGKSSLVKAGLLPRLDESVRVLELETRSGQLEDSLLSRLHRAIPGLERVDNLRDLLAAVRRGRGLPAGRKLLIVLDQFEQWLNQHGDLESSRLVEALRQCDGVRVQAMLLIRDDFAMATTRLMDALEQPLLQDRNFAAVDLFGLDHARKVLAAFGRAFGALTETPSREQRRFLDEAVRGLAEDGRVVPLRLALFAEMVKDRPWTPTTLRQFGGTGGVGVAFLDEKLSGPTTNPFLRKHHEATRQLLAAMLPEDNSQIKGRMQTRSELLQRLGGSVPDETLDRILRLLDSELRLITPSDPESVAGDAARQPAGEAGYQLTHDYLVPTLHSWLTAAQRTTRRGRAELRLRELADSWVARPEPRRLPSPWQWLNIRTLTRRGQWTESERRMMAAADRRYLLRGCVWLAMIALVALVAYEMFGRLQARFLRDRLLNAATAEVPVIASEVPGNSRWVLPLLERELEAMERVPETGGDAQERARTQRRELHVRMVLLEHDPEQLDPLERAVYRIDEDDLRVLSHFLVPYRNRVAPRLWDRLHSADEGQRPAILRLASVLAVLDPDSARWQEDAEPVADALISTRPFLLPPWIRRLAPVASQLKDPLLKRFRARDWLTPLQQSNIVDSLSAYAADDPSALAEVLQDADTDQFDTLIARLETSGAAGISALEQNLTGAVRRPSPRAAGTWPPPDPSAEQLLQSHGGLMAPHAAVVHQLPLVRFEELAKQLAPAGYRPASVRPFAGPEGSRVAASFHRDGRQWRVKYGLKADELAEADEILRREGLHLTDVADYRPDTRARKGATRFAALWLAPIEDHMSIRWYVDAETARHERDFAAWREQGFRLRRLLARSGPDGQPLYTAIWRGPVQDAGDDPLPKIRYAREFGDLYPGYLQLDYRLVCLDLSGPDLFGIHEAARRKEEQLQQDPNSVEDRITMARYLLRLGQIARARQLLDGLSSEAPPSLKLCQLRAEVLASDGDVESLREEVARCEQHFAGELEVELARIRLALLQQDQDQAIQRCQQLEARLEDSPSDTDLRGTVARAGALLAVHLKASDRPRAAQWRRRVCGLLRQMVADGQLMRPESLLSDVDYGGLWGEPEWQELVVQWRLDLRLCGVWQDSTDRESRMIMEENLENHRRACRALLEDGFAPSSVTVRFSQARGQLVACSLWQRDVEPLEPRVRRAGRAARLAVALARLGPEEPLLQLLDGQSGTAARSQTIDQVARLGLDPQLLVDAWQQCQEARQPAMLLRSLILALGAYQPQAVGAESTSRLISDFRDLVTSASDPGLRSAALWCLGQWRMDPPSDAYAPTSKAAQDLAAVDQRPWYVNSAGQTMIAVDPLDECLSGSPCWEAGRGSEQQHWLRIGRLYALAATETTVAQFKRFLEDPRVEKVYEQNPFRFTESYAPDSACPQISVSWFDAARFCQWLSQQEEIPRDQWCYPDIWEVTDEGDYHLPKDYLSRTGYRLPSEGEWEYACRAQSSASRHFGDADTLLNAYDWHSGNSGDRTHPVAALKPNDFGFFDMLGNVYEWCQEGYRSYRTPASGYVRPDEPVGLHVTPESKRAVRGGYFRSPLKNLRSANRNFIQAEYQRFSMGFRVARTLEVHPASPPPSVGNASSPKVR